MASSANQSTDEVNLVDYSSSDKSQEDENTCDDENSIDSDQNLDSTSVPGPTDSSLTDEWSEDEESICRSPAPRSPQKKVAKLSDALKRKRLLDLEEEEESPGASASDLPTDQDFQFKEPKFRKKKFIFHPFTRNKENICVPDQTKEPVEVIIPEQLAASYGLYIWPSAPVLAWYIWLNQKSFVGQRVLELGAGTALPGLLAAKLGAKVILSDSLQLAHCLENCREGIHLNNLKEKVDVVPLTWGSFTSANLKLRGALDFVIGSDLFFDPEVFEPLVVTVSWLLRSNPGAEFICSVQERSADWSIESLLLKWKLSCSYIRPAEFLKGSGINERDLTGNHKIFLLRIRNAGEQEQ